MRKMRKMILDPGHLSSPPGNVSHQLLKWKRNTIFVASNFVGKSRSWSIFLIIWRELYYYHIRNYTVFENSSILGVTYKTLSRTNHLDSHQIPGDFFSPFGHKYFYPKSSLPWHVLMKKKNHITYWNNWYFTCDVREKYVDTTIINGKNCNCMLQAIYDLPHLSLPKNPALACIPIDLF